MDELLRADRGRNRNDDRSKIWDDADRSALREVQGTPGPRVRRRSRADGTALLHERRIDGVQAWLTRSSKNPAHPADDRQQNAKNHEHEIHRLRLAIGTI